MFVLSNDEDYKAIREKCKKNLLLFFFHREKVSEDVEIFRDEGLRLAVLALIAHAIHALAHGLFVQCLKAVFAPLARRALIVGVGDIERVGEDSWFAHLSRTIPQRRYLSNELFRY